MRRSTQVLLVLMGGGMVSAAAIPVLRQPECDPMVPGGTCTSETSSTRSSSGFGSSAGRATGSGTADAATPGTTVARGGFGATGAARASSSGS